MKPVIENRYKKLPIEQLIVDLYFHDGVAIVRDNDQMPEHSPSRTLFNAVEGRISELRAEGYRALSFINAPDRRSEYYRDKYGVIAPVLAIIIVLLAVATAIYGGI